MEARALAVEIFGLAFDAGEPAFVAERDARTIVVANRALAALVGCAPEALIGRSLDELIVRQDRDALRRADGSTVAVAVALDVVDDPQWGAITAGRVREERAAAVAISERDGLVAARLEVERQRADAEHAREDRVQRERDRLRVAATGVASRHRAALDQIRAAAAGELEDAGAVLASSLARMAPHARAIADDAARAEIERLRARAAEIGARVEAHAAGLRTPARPVADSEEHVACPSPPTPNP